MIQESDFVGEGVRQNLNSIQVDPTCGMGTLLLARVPGLFLIAPSCSQLGTGYLAQPIRTRYTRDN